MNKLKDKVESTGRVISLRIINLEIFAKVGTKNELFYLERDKYLMQALRKVYKNIFCFLLQRISN